MILKVVTYVEIDRIDDQSGIPVLVDFLQNEFYEHLRKKSFVNTLSRALRNGSPPIKDFKIISVDDAFETLRTSK